MAKSQLLTDPDDIEVPGIKIIVERLVNDTTGQLNTRNFVGNDKKEIVEFLLSHVGFIEAARTNFGALLNT